jgi:hypothetical protein
VGVAAGARKTELRRGEEVATGDQVAPGSRWMEAGSQDVCGRGALECLREALEADAMRRRHGVACAYRPLPTSARRHNIYLIRPDIVIQAIEDVLKHAPPSGNPLEP